MAFGLLVASVESTFGGTNMVTKIANGVIVTIQVMSRAAIIIAMGMIFTVIGASIYGMLGTTH
jgi:hypothetical protein